MKIQISLYIAIFIFSGVGHAQVYEKPKSNSYDFMGQFLETKECFDKYIKTAPFSVTDASRMGWKTYENFRSKDNYKRKENIIPRRSIVKIKEGSEDFVNSPDMYIPVEVMGVAKSDHHDKNLKKSRLAIASGDRQRLDKVNIGKKGFLYSKSLKKADEYTYIVSEDSPILADNGLSDMGVVAIKPKVNSEGEYLVKQCCVAGNYKDFALKRKCTNKYSFNLVYKDNTVGSSIHLDANACNVANTLTPFKNDEVTAMMNFISTSSNADIGFSRDKIEMIDETGLVKIPLDYDSHDGKGLSGPFGSYHYNSDDKGASDAYAKPLTGCAFMKVLEKHQKDCQGEGCQIQFGDMFHLKSWGPHNYHGSGKCIDIRPLKKSTSRTSLTYHSKNYDREKTKKFIELLSEAGGSPIVFDDRKITNEFKDRSDIRPTSDGSHANHIHVCFDPSSKTVQDTCYKGF